MYYIISMMTTTTNSLRHFSLKLLLHFSNFPMVAHIEVCTPIISFPRRLHVSMTTAYCLKKPQALFFKITSSLLKLSNGSTHRGMYAYYIISTTITCFHDDRILFEKASGNFFKITSSLLKLANCSTHGDETWYECV